MLFSKLNQQVRQNRLGNTITIATISERRRISNRGTVFTRDFFHEKLRKVSITSDHWNFQLIGSRYQLSIGVMLFYCDQGRQPKMAQTDFSPLHAFPLPDPASRDILESREKEKFDHPAVF